MMNIPQKETASDTKPPLFVGGCWRTGFSDS